MKRVLQKAVCIVMIALFMVDTTQILASADNSNSRIVYFQVDTESGNSQIAARKVDGTWFADVRSLASMANCQISYNESSKVLTIYRPGTNVILYSIEHSDYFEQEGIIFVPFEKCAKSIGLRFQQYVLKKGLYVTAMKTPTDLQRVLSDIFCRNCYHLWEVPAELGMTWAKMEFLSRIWAAMPLVGNGSMLGTATGHDEQARYNRAIASAIAASGSYVDLIYSFSDMDKSLKSAGKKLSTADNVIGKIWDYIDNNDILRRKLQDEGMYDTVREMFRTGSNPYEEDIGEFFKGYPTVANAMDVDYWLETFAFYGAAVDGDEAIILAMKKVFGNSSNEYIKSAADKLFDSQFGANTSITDIYRGYIFDVFISQTSDIIEETLYGEMSLVDKFIPKIMTKAIEMTTDAPDVDGIANAIVYYSIYNTLAMELIEYYYQHRFDDTEHIGADLRAVAIMYLNTVRACVEECKFDSDLDDTTSNMDKVIDADLFTLLDYAEQEYDPSYSNECIIVYLDSILSSAISQTFHPSQASEEERQMALNAYSELVHDGLILNENEPHVRPVKASHYYLVDMDGDGIEEIILYASLNDIEWSFEILSFKDEKIIRIADSVNTCDISKWDNSAIRVEISNGIIHANVGKTVGLNSSNSDNYLHYDGVRVVNYGSVDSLPVPFGSDCFTLIRIDTNFGIMIGSAQDYLAQIYLQNHPVASPKVVPTPSPIPTPKATPTQSTANTLPDGEYYGLLTSWSADTMTVEMLEFEGLNENSLNYELSPTGRKMTLDISQATIWTEFAWSDDNVEQQFDSIESALNTKVFNGTSTLRQSASMQIRFSVIDGIVTQIYFLYAA